MQKKGAMELSIGTIVIIVLAMSMLILGLVLVRTIFTGAKYNVDTMNNKVRDEINKLFVEDKRMVLYLANQKADVDQGKDWGIAFAVKNLLSGADAAKFEYEVTVANPSEVKSNCGVNEKEAISWIKAGRIDEGINIAPGGVKDWIIRFEIPETAPLCIIRYNINVEADSEFYDAASFDIKVEG